MGDQSAKRAEFVLSMDGGFSSSAFATGLNGNQRRREVQLAVRLIAYRSRRGSRMQFPPTQPMVDYRGRLNHSADDDTIISS
jgi:hypothetical protein